MIARRSITCYLRAYALLCRRALPATRRASGLVEDEFVALGAEDGMHMLTSLHSTTLQFRRLFFHKPLYYWVAFSSVTTSMPVWCQNAPLVPIARLSLVG